MKCPKCGYIGFEATERCRHCGYEFSLLAGDAFETPDLPLRVRGDETERAPAWLQEAVDSGLGHRPDPSVQVDGHASDALASYEPEHLPLFQSPTDADDQPLITMAPPPRSPLAVRRTPVLARTRMTPRSVVPPAPLEPLLEFAEQDASPHSVARRHLGAAAPATAGPRVERRALAAILDATILLTIDAIVVYLTLRMASLPVEAWRQLPPAPVLAFLSMMKVAYYSVFTAYGGQTIGKMACGIRVVSDVDGLVRPQRAVGRALLWGASVATLGVPLVPWLLGGGDRALHDRLTQTRVVPQ